MDYFDELLYGLGAIARILAFLALVLGLEAWIPFVRPRPADRGRFRSNLALTGITLALNLVFGAALMMILQIERARDVGLAAALGLSGWTELVTSLVVLDFSFYVAHVAMHKLPALWRFHAVHHGDPMVDVTTTLRQHPGEFSIRTIVTAAFACTLGVSPASYAVYRTAVAISGLLEHANLRIPRRIDRVLSLVTTWPGFHKVHHARTPALTNSNYANLFSVWDRLFGTATTDFDGREPDYGLDGFAGAQPQTLSSLLALPHRMARPRAHSPDGLDATGCRLARE